VRTAPTAGGAAVTVSGGSGGPVVIELPTAGAPVAG
jgi:hypothetical protein